MKELKVDVLTTVVWFTTVESGEGIERTSYRRLGRFDGDEVESGEGIESSGSSDGASSMWSSGIR